MTDPAIIKNMLVGSTVALGGIATINPLSTGEAIGKATPSVILGIVAVACVIALVRLYRDKQAEMELARKAHGEHTKRLYAMIEANTRASQAAADAQQAQIQLMVEVKDALLACRVAQEIRK